MASRFIRVTVGATSDAIAPGSNTVVSEIAALEAAELAAVTAAIAAAQAIGVGDASAEIDTIDTDFVAAEAAIAAIDDLTSDGIIVVVDTTVVGTKNKLRRALEAVIKHFNTTELLSD